MAKKKHHRRGGLTAWRAIRGIILFGPVTAKALNAYSQAGGGATGVSRGILPAITTSYIGLNTNDGNFYSRELIWGWGPALIVWAMSKMKLGRLFRV